MEKIPSMQAGPGSGNVSADLELAEPEEELTKAQLASHMRHIIRRRLTQVAARLMALDQPKVSALLNGRLANFSSERLMRLLTTLGQGVGITVKAKPRNPPGAASASSTPRMSEGPEGAALTVVSVGLATAGRPGTSAGAGRDQVGANPGGPACRPAELPCSGC
jgi:predicted XRE-type DNA-binding protein